MRRELSEDSSASGSESFISRILFFRAARSATKVDSLTVLCKDIAHLLQHFPASLLFLSVIEQNHSSAQLPTRPFGSPTAFLRQKQNQNLFAKAKSFHCHVLFVYGTEVSK